MRKPILRRALEYATQKHAETGKKYNGQPFIVHPILTAQILEMVQPHDINLIAAGYLHDILEDTPTPWGEFNKEFSDDIVGLVREVTKTGYNTFPYLKTKRGIMLKMADRLANISCTESWPEEKLQKYLDKSKFWLP